MAVASAWSFPFLDDIFTKINTQGKIINSQNVPLLAYAAGMDISSPLAADEVSIVAGSALLPDVGPLGGLVDVDNQTGDNGQISIYVVREKDSFASIAKMFGVSVNTILWANDLSRGAKLAVGQTLAILPVSGVKHIVKKGDTISSIAKKYKGDPDEIRIYNDVEGDMLVVNSEIIIPDGEIAIIPVATRVVTVTSKLRGADGMAVNGYYQAPIDGYRKSQRLHGYNGVDLVAFQGRGAPIVASADGVVVIARAGGYNGGYGTYAVIQHGNGTQTLYGHMQSITVSSGQRVAQGQMIGTMGSTGRSTGAHLHFEVRGARNPF